MVGEMCAPKETGIQINNIGTLIGFFRWSLEPICQKDLKGALDSGTMAPVAAMTLCWSDSWTPVNNWKEGGRRENYLPVHAPYPRDLMSRDHRYQRKRGAGLRSPIVSIMPAPQRIKSTGSVSCPHLLLLFSHFCNYPEEGIGTVSKSEKK